MPLTAFQREVFAPLRAGRSAGKLRLRCATVLNAEPGTPRYSRDIDLCHTAEEAVAASAAADEAALVPAGFRVRWLLRLPAFQRAEVSNERGSVKLEWAFDSAFRFFPWRADRRTRLPPPLLLDAATNKILALCARAEARDFVVDAIHLDEHLPASGLPWRGRRPRKDEGLNPHLILGSSRIASPNTDRPRLTRSDLAAPHQPSRVEAQMDPRPRAGTTHGGRTSWPCGRCRLPGPPLPGTGQPESRRARFCGPDSPSRSVGGLPARHSPLKVKQALLGLGIQAQVLNRTVHQ